MFGPLDRARGCVERCVTTYVRQRGGSCGGGCVSGIGFYIGLPFVPVRLHP